VDGDFQFTCPKEESAMLVLHDDTDTQDAQQKGIFIETIRQNYRVAQTIESGQILSST